MRLAIAVLLVWIGLSTFLDLNSRFLPDAGSFLLALTDSLYSVQLFHHSGVTFLRVLAGVAIALIIGIPLGLAMGRVPLLRRELGPMIEFVRGVPTSLLFPLFIVFFGIGEVSKIAICVFLAAPIIMTAAAVGATPRQRGQGREDYIRVHAQRISYKIKLASIIWDAAPSILTGVKVAVSLGLVVTIVTEMFFVSSSGLGWAAYRAYEAFDVDTMFVYIVTAGALSLLANNMLDRSIKSFTD